MASELGILIRDTRTALKISLRDFAKRIQKSPAFVVRMECDDEFPSASEETLRSVATELKLDSDTVISLAGKVPEDVLPESPLEVALYRKVKDLSIQRKQELLRDLGGDAA